MWFDKNTVDNIVIIQCYENSEMLCVHLHANVSVCFNGDSNLL